MLANQLSTNRKRKKNRDRSVHAVPFSPMHWWMHALSQPWLIQIRIWVRVRDWLTWNSNDCTAPRHTLVHAHTWIRTHLDTNSTVYAATNVHTLEWYQHQACSAGSLWNRLSFCCSMQILTLVPLCFWNFSSLYWTCQLQNSSNVENFHIFFKVSATWKVSIRICQIHFDFGNQIYFRFFFPQNESVSNIEILRIQII